ncbi:MAG: FtsQ-type POTRA domain-containing protein [Simkaniaceae bacterium]|nr:FtsQ-type POTRA domain-containing protein [Simkaniaceae bacterium]
MKKKREVIPLSTAIFIIIASVFLVSGFSFSLFKLYRFHVKKQLSDQSFFISHLIQTGPVKEGLSTQYLAELLGLSADRPTHMFHFDNEETKAKLKQMPIFESVEIKKIKPSTIYIDYTLRKPYAIISDYSNVATDRQGNRFPYRPFFTPKSIPDVYLGVGEANPTDQNEALTLALNVLKTISQRLQHTRLAIQRVDVSRAFLKSFGKKEIVVKLNDEIHYTYSSDQRAFKFVYLLRLNTLKYEKNLLQFLALRKELEKKQEEVIESLDPNQSELTRVIDLRIDNLAYIHRS